MRDMGGGLEFSTVGTESAYLGKITRYPSNYRHPLPANIDRKYHRMVSIEIFHLCEICERILTLKTASKMIVLTSECNACVSSMVYVSSSNEIYLVRYIGIVGSFY